MKSTFRPLLKRAPASSVRHVCAAAVNSTLGSADNDRFLEHFRYIIIASQLLSEHPGPTFSDSLETTTIPSYTTTDTTVIGAFFSAAGASVFVWIVNVARGDRSAPLSWAKTISLCLYAAFMLSLLYIYARRQRLKRLRSRAIHSATTLVVNLRALEHASTAAITLIQEVECLAHGYRISNPMPPVTRLEANGKPRRCGRLRRHLRISHTDAIPIYTTAVDDLRSVVDIDDLDRFLDVYDVRHEDIVEASTPYPNTEADQPESLSHLRLHQYRLSTLRRVFLCSLLSLPATSQQTDLHRWHLAIAQIERMNAINARLAQDLQKLLSDEDEPVLPSIPKSDSATNLVQNPTHARVNSQMRRISTMSTGIRSLQARLYLLRDDSNRALSNSVSESELISLSTSLREQYDGLGTDLQSLMQAWESGRAALSQNITRQTRRISRSNSMTDTTRSQSSEPRSPKSNRGVASQSYLSSVVESADPLRPRTIPLPLSPPATEDGSDHESNIGTEDNEVFEAIASPRVRERSVLSREQRIIKMQEDRERLTQARERKETSTHMLRELQTVIRMRPTSTIRRNSPADRMSL